MIDHDEANRLVDCADAKDREGYKRELDRVRKQYPHYQAANIERLARWQIHMQRNFNRIHGWRAEWVQGRNQKGYNIT